MKKLTVIFVCILMLLSLIACGGRDGGLVASVECPRSATEGDIVTVELVLDRKVSAMSGGVEVIYDLDVFEVVDHEWLLEDVTIVHYDTERDLGVFAYTSNEIIEGEVFRLTLRVIDGASKGPSRVQCNLRLKDQDNVQIELENRSSVIEIG